MITLSSKQSIRKIVSLYVILSYTHLVLKDSQNSKVFRVTRQRPSYSSSKEFKYKQGNHNENNEKEMGEGDKKDLSCREKVESIDMSLEEPNLDRIVRKFYKWGFILNLLTFMRCLMINLLDFNTFESYKKWDCFLLGRLSLAARIADISKVIALLDFGFALFLRIYLLLSRSLIRLDCVEFLRRFSIDELLLREVKDEDNYLEQPEHQAVARANKKSGLLVYYSKSNYNDSMSIRISDERVIEEYYESVLYYSNLLAVKDKNEESHHVRRFLLRPNRTAECWMIMCRFTVIYFVLGIITAFTFTIPMSRLSLPLIMTRRGFELNYANCVEYITGSKAANYSDIYEANYEATSITNSRDLRRTSQLNIPFENIVPLNEYHFARIAFDLFENYFSLMDSTLLFMAITYLAHLIFIDTYLYLSAIERRLNHLIARLNQLDSSNRLSFNHLTEHNDRGDQFVSSRREPGDHRCCDDFDCTTIADIQTIIVDYFAQVARYNPYISMFIGFIICQWFVYTCLIVAAAYLQTATMIGRFELYIGGLLSFSYFALHIYMFGYLKIYGRRIYLLTTKIVALDEKISTTKRRWTHIMRFFSPDPLYCYAMFRKVEVSWTLALKVG